MQRVNFLHGTENANYDANVCFEYSFSVLVTYSIHSQADFDLLLTNL